MRSWISPTMVSTPGSAMGCTRPLSMRSPRADLMAAKARRTSSGRAQPEPDAADIALVDQIGAVGLEGDGIAQAAAAASTGLVGGGDDPAG